MRVRMFGLALATATAMLGLSAPTATAAPRSGGPSLSSATAGTAHHVGRGRTGLTLDAGAAAALTSLGVTVTPVLAKARQAGGKTVVDFTIVGNPYDGTIEHVGGLLLRAGHKHLFLTGYTIDLGRGVLSGRVDFSTRADLFTIGAATPDGVTLSLTAGAAAVLNRTFGVSAFTAGLVIGYGNPQVRR